MCVHSMHVCVCERDRYIVGGEGRGTGVRGAGFFYQTKTKSVWSANLILPTGFMSEGQGIQTKNERNI